jgi:methionyl-tRNA synthetase
MSKSVGNVIDPISMAQQYGVDQVRYFFLREVPFGQDGNYSHDAIVNRINADLANDLGNLAQRSLSMIARNCASAIPQPGRLIDSDNALLGAAHALVGEMRAHHDEQAISKALDAIWRVVGESNRYFAAEQPWSLKKTDPERMATVLYVTAEVLRHIGILIQPYMPQSAAKLLDLLGVENKKRSFAELGEGGKLVPGTRLPQPAAIFPRYVEDDVSQPA